MLLFIALCVAVGYLYYIVYNHKLDKDIHIKSTDYDHDSTD